MQIATKDFAEYVHELREFSGTYHVPFGKPEDIEKLMETLKTSQTFSSDFESMFRSIIFRERFNAQPPELLRLVTSTWGAATADSPNQSPEGVLQELQSILQDILKRSRTGERAKPAVESARSTAAKSSADVGDKTSSSQEGKSGALPDRNGAKSAAGENEQGAKVLESTAVQQVDRANVGQAGTLNGNQEQHNGDPRPSNSSLRSALLRFANETETRGSPLLFHGPPYAAEPEATATPRRNYGVAETLALGLAGLVVGLLVTVNSLPVYRAHVSLYLPNENPVKASSDGDLLRSGKLPEQVADRLLIGAHPSPMFRQDALSRGMRDLHLGGRDTILYASLVAETARQVSVRPLQAPGLYEITCDSWSSQFAATFCNQLVDAAGQQPLESSGTQPGTPSARKVDADVGPGIQVYPHWYLQGTIGFFAGCLLSLLFDFVKRTRATAIR